MALNDFLASFAAPGGPYTQGSVSGRPGSFSPTPMWDPAGQPLQSVSSYPYGYQGSGWRYPLYGSGGGQPSPGQQPGVLYSPTNNPATTVPGITSTYPVINRTQGTRPMTAAEQAAWFAQQERTNPTYIGQMSRLFDQLSSQWTGGSVTPFQQAYVAYGGSLPDTIMQTLKNTTGYGQAPTWVDASGQTHSLGSSLVGALTPDILRQAAANPYSTLAQIAHAGADEVAGGMGSLAARGLLQSGAVRQRQDKAVYDTGLARYNAANQLLGGVQGNVNQFLSGLNTAADTSAQYLGQAQTQIGNEVTQGLTTPPKVTTNYVTPVKAAKATPSTFAAPTPTSANRPMTPMTSGQVGRNMY